MTNLIQEQKMIKKIKMITFDIDDTLWDNKPTIINAEAETRKWIEDRVGKINWGDLNDFLILRENLIKKDPSIAWDISKLRVEIFKEKIKEFVSKQECESIAQRALVDAAATARGRCGRTRAARGLVKAPKTLLGRSIHDGLKVCHG